MQYTLLPEIPEELAAEWNALLEKSATHVPFLRFEYLHGWWQTKGGGEWGQSSLALVTAREGGRLAGIAPLFKSRHQEKEALLLLGSIEISDYLDVLAAPEDLPLFWQGLLPFLKEEVEGWEVLDLYNLLETTPSLPALRQAAERLGWSVLSDVYQHSPYIPLPGDWETYLAGIDKKQRHEIRRKMRRAEELGLPVRFTTLEDGAALENEMDAFLALMQQDPDKAGFLTPSMMEQMRASMRCAFEAGCLHLASLEVNGQKAAMYLSFDYLNRLWVYNSGFDRAYMEYSPGWVLLGHLLKWANENGREAFDFMRGNEEYKYRFGAVDRRVLRVRVTPL